MHDGDPEDQELRDVVARLRAGRPEAAPVELDRIKRSAMARAQSPVTRGVGLRSLRSRMIAPILAIGIIGGGTTGVLAGGGGGTSGNGNGAANSQYCPPSSPAAGKPKHQSGGNKCGHGSNKGGSHGSNNGGSNKSHKNNQSHGS